MLHCKFNSACVNHHHCCSASVCFARENTEVICCLNPSEVNLNFSLDFMRLRFLPPIYDEVTASYSMVEISLAMISPTVPEIFPTIKKKAFWQLITTWHEEEWQSTHYIQVERILMAQKNEKSKIFIQIWTVIPLVTLEILYLLAHAFNLMALISIMSYWCSCSGICMCM